eukprot:16451532-Heterocapsa_arctica.AAC.1
MPEARCGYSGCEGMWEVGIAHEGVRMGDAVGARSNQELTGDEGRDHDEQNLGGPGLEGAGGVGLDREGCSSGDL